MLHLTLCSAVHGLFHAASIRPPRAHVAASAAAAKRALEGALAAGWQPKLQAHDIPVIELQGELTADALDRLLRHEACAVVVRGFVPADDCAAVTRVLCGESEAAWHNW